MLYFCILCGGGLIFFCILGIILFTKAIEDDEMEYLPLGILSFIGMFSLIGIMLFMC